MTPPTPSGSDPKKTAKKKVAEKAVTKKASAKKAEPAARKAPAKKAGAGKTAVGAAADTARAVKAVAEKAGAEAADAVKAVAKGAGGEKAVTKKPVAKKTGAGKAVAKKALVKEAAVDKPVVKKAAAKKAAVKKAAVKKAPAEKAPAKKVTARRTAATKAAGEHAAVEPVAPAPVPPPETPVSPAMDAGDRDRLLSGTHHDPHGVLGAHPVPGGVAFRVFRPYALGVTVVAGDVRAELQDDGDGFFSGLLPLREIPAYRLLVTYEESVQDTEDAYAFLPALGDLDLHLIGEGRHEQLWTALGAQPMTHQGSAGTRFTVWAPNARGVRVAGTFNFWDPSAFAMRSLGSTGVWELFVPGVGEGELYKFEITRPDGSKTLRADPLARRTEVPPATSSIIHASHHEWQDGGGWRTGRPERRPTRHRSRSTRSISRPGGPA